MKTNELRIGNLISHNIYGICEITALDYESICIQRTDQDIKEWFDIEDYEPVVLTEYWLLKYRFEWSIFHQAYHKEGFDYDLNSLYKGGFDLTTFKRQMVILELQYVHQLQNIYFELKKLDLIINL